MCRYMECVPCRVAGRAFRGCRKLERAVSANRTGVHVSCVESKQKHGRIRGWTVQLRVGVLEDEVGVERYGV